MCEEMIFNKQVKEKIPRQEVICMPYLILGLNTGHCILDKKIIELKKTKKWTLVTEQIRRNRDQVKTPMQAFDEW